MTSQIEHITPAFARIVMEQQDAQAQATGCPVNRKIQRIRVDNYARQMVEGKWKLNGAPLIFNGTQMLDGQHRLLAVMKAGVTVPMLVVRGVDTDAFATIDVGKPRSTSDVLSVRGISNTTLTAGAASIAMHYLRYGSVTGNPAKRFSQAEIADFVSANAERFADAVKAFANAHQVVGSPSALVALSYLVAAHPRRQEFFDRLKDGADLSATHPVLHLRRVLMNARDGHIGTKMHIRFAMIIKAWNAFAANEPMKMLRWRDSFEEFPSLSI